MVVSLLLCAAPALADDVYRWVDAQGQMHLSDRPPEAGVKPEVLTTPRYVEPRLSPREDPYSIFNQARRLEEQRRALMRERQKAEREKREYELQRRRLEAVDNAIPPQSQVAPRIVGSRPIVVVPRPILPYQFPQRRGLWQDEHPVYSPQRPRYPQAWPRPSR